MTQSFVTPLTLKAIPKNRRIGLQFLPQEILLMISTCLPLLELVALSQVSERTLFVASTNHQQTCRLLWHLLKDDLLWRTLYRSTQIVRPPGPFPAQCTMDLRKILISTARVASCWPPGPSEFNFRKNATVPMVDAPNYCFLLYGRWLIAANSSLAVYYDMRERPQPQPNLFYRPHLVATFFRCVTTTNVNGDALTFLVTETQVGSEMRKVYECPLYFVELTHNQE